MIAVNSYTLYNYDPRMHACVFGFRAHKTSIFPGQERAYNDFMDAIKKDPLARAMVVCPAGTKC